MSRSSVLLRALNRLPGAVFPEASSAVRAAVSRNGLAAWSTSIQGSQQAGSEGFKMQVPRNSLPFSFASQMHTLTRKEEEQQGAAAALAVPEVPKVPTALTALPPKPKMSMARRSMASAADGEHLEYGVTHPFHILPPSPWPFCAGMASLPMMLGMAGWFHCIPGMAPVMFGGLGMVGLTALAWWRDAIIESEQGMHTEVQRKNLINGIWIFIVSEAALFFGLLWSCVHLGMSPNVYVQMQWPPVGIEPIGWEGRALVMSAVLAASYYSANVAMVSKDPKVVMGALGTTVGLGALFLADQYLEYTTAPFTITDSAYGTTFFVTTGFHGFHVLLGSLWLATAMANYARVKKPTVTLKGAVLYWHFVDIVWIAVYGIIYAAQL